MFRPAAGWGGPGGGRVGGPARTRLGACQMRPERWAKKGRVAGRREGRTTGSFVNLLFGLFATPVSVSLRSDCLPGVTG